MGRFDAAGERRFSARDALVAVGVCALLLVLFSGGSVKRAGAEMSPGVSKSIVEAVGKPTATVADALPFATIGHRLTGWLSPEDDLGSSGSGFVATTTGGVGVAGASTVPPVTPDAFDPASVGAPAPPRKPLHTLLVTGDSLSQPLDQELARRLAGSAKVVRDPHIGTGISKSLLVDWGKLSVAQVKRDKPDAVVVFIGANEGFPMKGGPGGREVQCCGADYAAVYASRVRQMMNTYRQAGAARVYWLTLPTPRDPDRQKIARTVNAAISVAAEPWRSQVRVFDTVPIFTPGARYRDAMPINGADKIVRESDGIHLNLTGSSYLADQLLPVIDRDFVR
jgi:lysophospholipase L1-like esterase